MNSVDEVMRLGCGGLWLGVAGSEDASEGQATGGNCEEEDRLDVCGRRERARLQETTCWGVRVVARGGPSA